jgi:hypothetical protein
VKFFFPVAQYVKKVLTIAESPCAICIHDDEAPAQLVGSMLSSIRINKPLGNDVKSPTTPVTLVAATTLAADAGHERSIAIDKDKDFLNMDNLPNRRLRTTASPHPV